MNILAEEPGLDYCPTGCTTFRRADHRSGLEPDASYYLGDSAPSIRGAFDIDLTSDPPPNLVIDVNITPSHLDRFGIFAALGVQEVWRYDGDSLTMHTQAQDGYEMIGRSKLLPPMTANQAAAFLRASRHQTAPSWYHEVRQWVRDHA